jgi:hypothetical protein
MPDSIPSWWLDIIGIWSLSHGSYLHVAPQSMLGADMQELAAALTASKFASLQFGPAHTPSIRTVYYNGFAPGWRSASYGCVDCEFSDAIRKYSGSTLSVYA